MESQKQLLKQSNSLNTNLNGSQLNLSLFEYQNKEGQKQNGLKILIKCQKNKERYQGMLKYEQQSQNFQFLFASMDETIHFIQSSIDEKDDMVKITQNGKLQICTKFNKKLRYLTLETIKVQIKQDEIQLQANPQIKKDIIDLQILVKDLKTEIAQIKNQIKKKVGQDQNSAILQDFQNLIENKLKENQKKTQKRISDMQQNIKTNQNDLLEYRMQISNKLLNYKKQNQDKFFALKIENQDKFITFKKEFQFQFVKYNKQNDDQYFLPNEQNQNRLFEVQKEIIEINKIIKELKRNYIFNSSQKKQIENHVQLYFQKSMKYKFDQLGIKKILLTANIYTNQFKQGYFRMKNNKIFQKCKDNNIAYWEYKDNTYGQVVSKQALPSTGKYFFQVYCHKSVKNYTFIGILTQNCLQNQFSWKNKQSISYGCYGGYLYENGSKSYNLGRGLKNQKELISVLVDMQNKQIHWFIGYEYQGKAKINKNLLNKKLYAFVQQNDIGSQFEFIS